VKVKRDDCPICGETTAAEHKPFCSRGCKDRDLLQWLGEGYRLPGARIDDESLPGLDTTEPRD
jgi:endogenous inhibitor of DNA gyrase (YacG/DUF329 family)